MGCNFSEQADTSRDIEKKMHEHKRQNTRTTKLLLLGMGDVGKTTFFRQFTILYGHGFSDIERHQYKQQIAQQCIHQMKRLIQGCNHHVKLGQTQYKISETSCSIYENLCSLSQVADLTIEIAEWIESLWNDPVIKHGALLGSQIGVAPSSQYFWDRIRDIANPEYIPSDPECMKLRSPTTGVLRIEFDDPNARDDPTGKPKIQIIDVGGQRNERKKWVTVFDDCSAILWVASLSAYCEVLFEDSTSPAMDEQLKLFDETINLEVFIETPVILFLNKSDLFRENLKDISLKECFPEYEGSDDFEEASQFVARVFKALDQSDGTRRFFSHVTCAVNKKNVETVFNDVTLSIVYMNTANVGLF